MWNGNGDPRGTIVTPRLIVGLAIALFGVVLIFDRLNLVMADRILRFWPAVIVAVGAMIFVQSRKVGGGVNGIIVMLVGGWLLLNSLGVVKVRFWELFWPMVLITIGTILVAQTLGRRSRDASATDADQTLNGIAVLSGLKRISTARRFRGGELTFFMGGGHIDLSQATIPPGEEAVLDIFSVIGGCQIIVPPSWTVLTPLVPIMGGIEDKRVSALPSVESVISGHQPPRLVLRGLLVMGGIEIKS